MGWCQLSGGGIKALEHGVTASGPEPTTFGDALVPSPYLGVAEDLISRHRGSEEAGLRLEHLELA